MTIVLDPQFADKHMASGQQEKAVAGSRVWLDGIRRATPVQPPQRPIKAISVADMDGNLMSFWTCIVRMRLGV